MTKKLQLVKTVFLKAPRAHVWRFLTEKDKLALWFHMGEADLKPGGDYAVLTNSLGKEGERLVSGKVIEFDPPKKLVHSFTHGMLKGVETICAWELDEFDGGTMLTLTHSGWEKVGEGAFLMTANHDTGWDEHFVRLRRVTS
jgi:uncharacterized protein YndB with AHSA1/START domain